MKNNQPTPTLQIITRKTNKNKIKRKKMRKTTNKYCNTNNKPVKKTTLKTKWNNTGNDTLIVTTINIRGRFRDKVTAINRWLNKQEINVLILTEVQVDEEVGDEFTNIITGYVTHVNSKFTHKHG